MKVIKDTYISNWTFIWGENNPEATDKDTLCFICNNNDTLKHMSDAHDLILSTHGFSSTEWIQKQRVLR